MSDHSNQQNCDHCLTRKEFLTRVLLTGAGLGFVAVLLNACGAKPASESAAAPASSPNAQPSPNPADAGAVAKAADIGVGESIAFPHPKDSYPVLLIHLSANTFVAYKRVCTHMSCPVNWVPDKGRIICPCHGGQYSAEDGSVLQQPPTKPLESVKLRIERGLIFVEKS